MFLDFSRELKIWVYRAKVKLFYKMVEFGILPLHHYQNNI